MKKTIFPTMLALGLLGATAGSAQSSQLEAQVPFNFMAGAVTHPAGKCAISATAYPSVLMVRCEGDNYGTFVSTMAAERSGTGREGKLVFNRYGERYFLSQIWAPGSHNGRELSKTKAEREIARTLTPELAVVALR